MTGPFDSLGIDISEKCNLRCAYCFEIASGLTSVQPVKLEKLFKGIDSFLEKLKPPEVKKLHFHFGRREPLLNFPQLSEITSYLCMKGDALSFQPMFHLTTNGTCLNLEIVRFLRQHSFDLRISIDGFQKLHDTNRKFKNGVGTFARIYSNLKLLKKENVSFTANTVYLPGSNYQEICSFFNDLGVKRVDFFPLWVPDNDPVWAQHKTINRKTLKKFDEWAESPQQSLLSESGAIGIKVVQVEKYLQHLFGFRSSSYYCGAGRNYVGITSNGSFYPCLKFINSDDWVLGNFWDGIDCAAVNTYLKKVAPPVDKLYPCNGCSIKLACKGLCYVNRLNISHHRKAFDFYCSFQRSLFELTKRLYDGLKNQKPEVLVQMANLNKYVEAGFTMANG